MARMRVAGMPPGDLLSIPFASEAVRRRRADLSSTDLPTFRHMLQQQLRGLRTGSPGDALLWHLYVITLWCDYEGHMHTITGQHGACCGR